LLEEDLTRGIWPPCVDKVLKSNERIFILDPSKPCDCPVSADHRQDTIGINLLQNGDKIHGVLVVSFANDLEIDEGEKNFYVKSPMIFHLGSMPWKQKNRTGVRRSAFGSSIFFCSY
jgi:hypothetical protein